MCRREYELPPKGAHEHTSMGREYELLKAMTYLVINRERDLGSYDSPQLCERQSSCRAVKVVRFGLCWRFESFALGS